MPRKEELVNQLGDAKTKIRFLKADLASERQKNAALNKQNHELKDELISINKKCLVYVEKIVVLQEDNHHLRSKRNSAK